MEAGAQRALTEPGARAAATRPDAEVEAAAQRFLAGGDTAPLSRFSAELAERGVEYEAIADMLLANATPGIDARRAEVIARSIAAGCLGERHLWRDLDLPNRSALRGLFEVYFEPFAADNVMDMRWKKFVYRKLCRWGGFNTCAAPSCGVCTSYLECFGE